MISDQSELRSTQRSSALIPRPRAVGWAAFAALTVIYSATLAPSVTWWDSGELIAAVHSLGIPHPPGTALYVIVGKVWALLTWPLDFAVRVNLLSAVATAAAVAILATMFARWTRSHIAAFAGAICAGAASSVWRNATEAEVYALALLGSALILWSADRAGREDGARSWQWILLTAYVCGLSYSLHLAALVAVPAAVVLGIPAAKRINFRRAAQVAAVALLGASAVLYLIVRAQHDPWVNQGNPVTWPAFLDVLGREQYADPGFWSRQAPLYLQIGNWFEYADWQFALGLQPSPPPSLARTSVTVLFVALGLYGSRAHRNLDRRGWRALLLLFATASLGVILYLNLKAGPSFGEGLLPAGAPREARERDYFFTTSFLVWGLWAGFGAVRAVRTVGARLASPAARTILRLAGMAVVTLPVALNWKAVDRRVAAHATAARDTARELLGRVPPSGVLLAAGDNDTYPLWYAQQVEKIRGDVTVVTVPLLGTAWYRHELARRHSLVDSADAGTWRGLSATLAQVCSAAHERGRPIMVAPGAATRTLPASCLTSPSPGTEIN
ncbi:MAG: glycosyltransferase family 117 protein [Gemmatimonadaceae bacterium]